jgi:hypothetical protein
MGSSASGSSAAESSKEKSQTFAKQSVASSGKTVTTSSGAKAPVPPPRPDLNYQSKSILGKIQQDISMGVDDLVGQRSDKYTPAEWQAYDIRTAQTQARTAAQERDRSDRDDDRPAPAPVVTPGDGGGGGTPSAPTAPVTQTPSVETAQADLTRAVDELTMPAGDRAARERAAGTPEMDLGTAAGAAAERAAAEKTAASQAEREAADALLKGRRSTILTTPGGLLAPSEEQTTRTRSLIGGRSRA